jgi:hypothetical protein
VTDLPTKVCTKCSIAQPLDAFDNTLKSSDGKTWYCKACIKAYNAARQSKPKVVPSEKRCRSCNTVKPIEEFGKDKYTADGYTARCKACKHAEDTAWRTNNPEAARAKTAKWKREHPEEYQAGIAKSRERKNARARERARQQTDKVKAYSAAYYLTNKERLRSIRRAWDRAHPAFRQMKAARRRAREQALPNTWTQVERAFMFSYWHHACAVCGNEEGFFWSLAVDHWIPLISPASPGTVAINMVVLCHGQGGCNNLKRGRDPHDWLVERYGVKKAARIEKAIATYFAIVAERFGHAATG